MADERITARLEEAVHSAGEGPTRQVRLIVDRQRVVAPGQPVLGVDPDYWYST